jgi:hypothetical protein
VRTVCLEFFKRWRNSEFCKFASLPAELLFTLFIADFVILHIVC